MRVRWHAAPRARRLARMKDTRSALVARLEERFRWLTVALYDTSVPPSEVDAAIRPYLDERIRFVDP